MFTPAPTPDRYEALAASLEQPVKAGSGGDLAATLVGKIRVAAQGDNADEQAWALVVLAAKLRQEDRAEEAFEVLLEASRLAEDKRVKVAAITVTMAIHCDLGRDQKARDIGLKANGMSSDPYLLRVLGRAWSLGYRATGIMDFKDAADSCFWRAESMSNLAHAEPDASRN